MGAPVALIGGGSEPVLTASFTITLPTALYRLLSSLMQAQSPRDTITEYRWDFGDQSGITLGTPLAPHTYDTIGAYTVTLEIVTSDGLTTQTQRIVNVSDTAIAPTAILAAT